MHIYTPNLYAVILAGGKGTRMRNEDKPLIQLNEKPLIQWAVQKIQNHVGKVIISANHNLDRYQYLQLDLVSDIYEKYKGPLVGIYSAMKWIQNNVTEAPPSALLCIPGDVPFFPNDLISKLWEEFSKTNCEVVSCESDGQIQPLFSIWSLSSTEKLYSAINRGLFGPKLVLPLLDSRVISVTKASEVEFFNVNNQESLKYLQKLINS